jgi:hypothetical protein
VRFRSFEQPVVLQARQAVFDEAERLLGELVQGDNGDNAQRIEALVASPEPLIRLLAQRFGSASTAPEPILEVLTRRYYRRRSLENLRSFRLDGRPCVTGEYALSGAQLHLVSLMAEVGELAEALTSLGALMEGSPTRRTSSSTCTCRGPTGPRTPTRCRGAAGGAVAQRPAAPRRRVTATVCTPEGEVEPITFRPAADGLAEERLIRGLHPLTAQRLNLWRLKNFTGVRLPSPRTPTCSTSSRRTTRTTNGSSRWPRCAT